MGFVSFFMLCIFAVWFSFVFYGIICLQRCNSVWNEIIKPPIKYYIYPSMPYSVKVLFMIAVRSYLNVAYCYLFYHFLFFSFHFIIEYGGTSFFTYPFELQCQHRVGGANIGIRVDIHTIQVSNEKIAAICRFSDNICILMTIDRQ